MVRHDTSNTQQTAKEDAQNAATAAAASNILSDDEIDKIPAELNFEHSQKILHA